MAFVRVFSFKFGLSGVLIAVDFLILLWQTLVMIPKAFLVVAGILFIVGISSVMVKPVRLFFLTIGSQLGIVQTRCYSGLGMGNIVLPVVTCKYVVSFFDYNLQLEK